MDLEPGTVVANRYRISRAIGRGGMGEVFAAENIRTGRPVAVKFGAVTTAYRAIRPTTWGAAPKKARAGIGASL